MKNSTINDHLNALLDRLEKKSDDDIKKVWITGRAISRSETSLHLQTVEGTTAIKLSEIVGISESSEANSNVVSVQVSSVEAVKHVVPVSNSLEGQCGDSTGDQPKTFRSIARGLPALGGRFFGVTQLPDLVLTACPTATMSTITDGPRADASDADDATSCDSNW